jgi:hypothetical protein
MVRLPGRSAAFFSGARRLSCFAGERAIHDSGDPDEGHPDIEHPDREHRDGSGQIDCRYPPRRPSQQAGVARECPGDLPGRPYHSNSTRVRRAENSS